MSEDQLMKMFKYMQKEFTAVRTEIAEVKTNIDTYANSVDGFAKQSELQPAKPSQKCLKFGVLDISL